MCMLLLLVISTSLSASETEFKIYILKQHTCKAIETLLFNLNYCTQSSSMLTGNYYLWEDDILL